MSFENQTAFRRQVLSLSDEQLRDPEYNPLLRAGCDALIIIDVQEIFYNVEKRSPEVTDFILQIRDVWVRFAQTANIPIIAVAYCHNPGINAANELDFLVNNFSFPNDMTYMRKSLEGMTNHDMELDLGYQNMRSLQSKDISRPFIAGLYAEGCVTETIYNLARQGFYPQTHPNAVYYYRQNTKGATAFDQLKKIFIDASIATPPAAETPSAHPVSADAQ